MANIPGTNVPAISFDTALGFIAPTGPAILAGVQADIDAAFGSALSYELTTPQGQIASSEAAIISNFDGLLVYYSNQTNPSYAVGRMQDAIGNIYFLTRRPAQSTVLQVACVGLQGTAIPQDSTIQDSSGNTYGSTTAGTIPAGGSITIPFANLLSGPIPAPASDQVSIYQAIPGWDTVTVVSSVVGVDVEGQTAFEERRRESVAGNSFGAIGSIIGAVSKVAGVVDYFGYDNTSASPVTIFGVSVSARSIYISVEGGSDADVAHAIITKKGPGCSYASGANTAVTTYDSNPLYSAPVPYVVRFERPASLDIMFQVNIVNGPTVPADALTQVQAAIVAAAEGQDGGARARIASTILAARYVTPVQALGSWAKVSTLFVGSKNTAAATFTGSIAGTTLTVSGVSGTIVIGQTLDDDTGDTIPGTTITAGSGLSWTVSSAQTVASQAMYGVLATGTQVVVRADQIPVVSAPNIQVALI